MRRYHLLFWDNKTINHIAGHGVTPDEVEQAVFSPKSHIRRGRGQKVYYSLRQTSAGRYLFVVLQDKEAGVGRVVTARDMSEKEKRWCRQYRRKMP